MECTKDIECLRELVGSAVCSHNGIEYTDGQSWSRVSPGLEISCVPLYQIFDENEF